MKAKLVGLEERSKLNYRGEGGEGKRGQTAQIKEKDTRRP